MNRNNVTSKPVKQPRKNPTAIISNATAQAAANHTIRWTSVLVLGFSFIGSIIAFNGHWPSLPHFWIGLSALAVVAGIALQAFCTVLEWGYRNARADPRYFVPLFLDIGSTYLGYSPLFVPPLLTGLTNAGVTESIAKPAAHITVILISILAAYYPEQTLVDE